MTTLPPKTIMQPFGDTLTTSGNVTLLLPKLPPAAKEAYHGAGLTNNLLSASALADAGCELFFHQTGCEVMHNGKIILRVPLQSNENNIVPRDTHIFLPTKSLPQAHSIYECENTYQLINFYYATMGYPAISKWCKVINRGYFQGWPGLTSTRVRWFIKPSEHHLMGHLDQRKQGIRSTKSPPTTSLPNPMAEPPQLPLNDKTNMVFMTMVDIQGQLYTDQTGHFPINSNRGNNYVVIFYTVDANHIKS
ncbi:hypothetical protein ACHAW6_004261 [Cyclotella cf. meneghiniana]